MIYLQNITSAQGVLIPSNGLTGRAAATLRLTSTISGELVYEQALSVNEDGGYYRLEVTLPEGLAAGEYAYALSYELESYASGLCQIGEHSRPIQQGDGGFILKQAK